MLTVNESRSGSNERGDVPPALDSPNVAFVTENTGQPRPGYDPWWGDPEVTEAVANMWGRIADGTLPIDVRPSTDDQTIA